MTKKTTIPEQNRSENWCIYNINDTNIGRFENFIPVAEIVDITGTAGVTQEHPLINLDQDKIITEYRLIDTEILNSIFKCLVCPDCLNSETLF